MLGLNMFTVSPEGMNDPENGASNLDRNIKVLYKLCVETGALTERAAEALIDMGFLSAPASAKYHGNYAGGLFDHSCNVATVLIDLTKSMGLKWDDPGSPIRIGILHDLCKADQYEFVPESNSYNHKDNTLITGHGIKSVVLAQRLPDVKLTEEEIACILYHMGAFTDEKEWKSYTNAIHKYPNVLWTHTADCYAAHVMEV